jgi:outer membrane biosynthesis protein TonB
VLVHKISRIWSGRRAQRLVMLLMSIVLASSLAAGYARVYAASARLYLSPASKTINQSTTFAVQVRVDTGGNAVNAVQASLSYPASRLDFISISGSGSAFEIAAPSSGGGGTVDIARGTTGTVNGDHLVATVTFKSKTTSGSAAVSFTGESYVVRASDSQDVLGSTNGGTYTVQTPPPPPSPTPSPTPSPSPNPSPPPAATPKPSPSPSPVAQPSPTPSSQPHNPQPTPSSSGPKAVTPDGQPTNAIAVSDVRVSDIASKSATISWKTDKPATSVVEYDIDEDYNLKAQAKGAANTTHRVLLPSDTLSPGTTFYFRVSSTDAAGNTAYGASMSFRTKGVKLIITVVNESGDPVSGAEVRVGDLTGTTDESGVVKFDDAGVGQQTVVISVNGTSTETILDVKDTSSMENPEPQSFQLTASQTGNADLLKLLSIAVGSIVLLTPVIVVLWWLIRRHRDFGWVPHMLSRNSGSALNGYQPTAATGSQQPQLNAPADTDQSPQSPLTPGTVITVGSSPQSQPANPQSAPVQPSSVTAPSSGQPQPVTYKPTIITPGTPEHDAGTTTEDTPNELQSEQKFQPPNNNPTQSPPSE